MRVSRCKQDQSKTAAFDQRRAGNSRTDNQQTGTPSFLRLPTPRPAAHRPSAYRIAVRMPLDRYYAHGEIDQRLWRAGERFRALVHQASCIPHASVGYGVERVDNGRGDWFGGIAPNERAAEARKKLRVAVTTVGPVLSPVLIAVLVGDQPAGAWSRSCGRPAAHGLPTLIAALESLALHFGIA